MKRITLSCIAIGMLASCASGPETKPVTAEMAPAPLPTYAVGDKFVWQTKDGLITSELVSIENGDMFWKNSDGSSWTSEANFAMPAIEWFNPNESGSGHGEQQASEIRGTMFPLKVGNKMTMRVQGQSEKYPEGWNNKRNCSAKSQENITVPAGAFDAYKVVCVSGKRTRTFFYSPEVGHIVYYKSHHTDKGGEPRFLVSYERSQSWADNQEGFDTVLENLKRSEVIAHISGNTETWTKGGGYYAPDGTLNILWKGKENVGTWEVSDEGEVCYVVKTWGPEKECHQYVREAGQTKLLYEGEARLAKILPGNQLELIKQ